MHFNTSIFRNRAIINVDDESFGITFTHWTKRRCSWSLRWQEVHAIDAMVVEIPCFEFGFFFQVSEDKGGFISNDMENWSMLVESVRKRYPDFNWANIDTAKRFENKNKRIQCWTRGANDLSKIVPHSNLII